MWKKGTLPLEKYQFKGEWQNLNQAGVVHRALSPFVYAYDQETVHVRLMTAKDDIEKVELIYGDPYEWEAEKEEDRDWNFDPEKEKSWKVERTPMQHNGSDATYDYWFVAIRPERKRVRYGFEVHGDTTAVLTERGWYDEAPLDHPGYYFSVPYVHATDVFDTPEWVKDTVWYQIFPERFANGDRTNDPAGTKEWGSEAPAFQNFFGGDFQGVIDHVDHLQRLGVTGVYFCPVFEAPSNHKYDTLDYLKLDPAFGDEKTFRKMIDVLHENGIRVLLDAVFNHISEEHPAFQDVLEKGQDSKYANWFTIDSFPVDPSIPNYEVFAFERNMPKLNTAHPDVKDYLLHVGRYWVEEFGIDGWRLDVASEVDHAFWREFRKEVRAANGTCYIVGECWTDSQPWLLGDQFDAVMNYGLTESFLTCFATGETRVRDFSHAVSRNLNWHSQNVNEVMFNLIDSHDTPRALTRAKGNIDRMKLLFTTLLTFPGSPVIYYGDEIGMKGGQDPANRACMEWDETKQNLELFDHVAQLIALRKQHPVLANAGTYHFQKIDDTKQTFIVERRQGEQVYLLVVNVSEEVQSLSLEGTYESLLDGTTLSGTIQVEAVSALLLRHV